MTFPNIWEISMTFSFNQCKKFVQLYFCDSLLNYYLSSIRIYIRIFGEIVFVSVQCAVHTHHIHKLWLTQQLKASDMLSRRKNIKNTNNDLSMLKIFSMKINRVWKQTRSARSDIELLLIYRVIKIVKTGKAVLYSDQEKNYSLSIANQNQNIFFIFFSPHKCIFA